MPERGFSTDYWYDPFVEGLPLEGKLLYPYLWTNRHCSHSGLYEITLTRIAQETKIPQENLPDLLKVLEPKVKWYPDESLIWVKNFIRRQSRSPKFLIAVAKALESIHNNGAIKELIDYNRQKYGISIPYQYPTDRVSIRSGAGASANASAKELGVVKGEGEKPGDEKLAAMSSLYEDNIAIMTPMAAEKLKDIAEKYSIEWFKDALSEAVQANVRRLAYVQAILGRWEVEGKGPLKGRAKFSNKELDTLEDLEAGWKPDQKK